MTHADGSKVVITDLKDIDERLDLWGGILTSSFTVDGTPVHVETIAHPDHDEVAVRIDSPLIAAGRLKVRIAISLRVGFLRPRLSGLDSSRTPLHHAHSHRRECGAVRPHTRLNPLLRPRPLVTRASLAQTAPHQYLLSSTANRIDLTTWFSPTNSPPIPDTVTAVEAASRAHWQHYWSTGGAIDLSGNTDPRAAELERRIVLSQYVMAVHDAQLLPVAGDRDSASTPGTENFTWRCTGGTPRTGRLWGHPKFLKEVSTTSPSSCRPVRRWRSSKAQRCEVVEDDRSQRRRKPLRRRPNAGLAATASHLSRRTRLPRARGLKPRSKRYKKHRLTQDRRLHRHLRRLRRHAQAVRPRPRHY